MYKKILIIQTAYLGDLIWTTPLIKTISTISKSKSVDVLCLPSTADIIEGLPFVNKTIIHDKRKFNRGIFNIPHLINSIRKEGYDLVISPHLSLRSSLISLFSGAKLKCGFDEAVLSSIYNRRVKYNKSIHFVDRFLTLAKALRVDVVIRELSVSTDDESEKIVDGLLEKDKDYTAIIPGSRWATKRYPVEYYKELIDKIHEDINHSIVILGTPDEKHICKDISNSRDYVINLCGRTSLKVLAAILRRVSVTIGGDCGGMHIAEAVYTPSIFLYGSTSPYQGIGPIQGNFRSLTSSLPCSPCSVHGLMRCPEGFKECMSDIKPDTVFETLKEIIL